MKRLRIGSVIKIEKNIGIVRQLAWCNPPNRTNDRMLILWASPPRRHMFKYPREEWFLTDQKWVVCTVVVW